MLTLMPLLTLILAGSAIAIFVFLYRWAKNTFLPGCQSKLTGAGSKKK